MFKKLSYLFVIGFCLLLLATVATSVFAANKAGIKLYTVDANSATSAVKAGDLAIGKKTSPSLLRVGDTITYKSLSGTEISTKQIESINPKTRAIQVQSGNQFAPYEIVQPTDVLAKNIKTVPYLGYGLSELRRPAVLISLVYIPILWIVLREGRRLARQYWRKPYSVS